MNPYIVSAIIVIIIIIKYGQTYKILILEECGMWGCLTKEKDGQILGTLAK